VDVVRRSNGLVAGGRGKQFHHSISNSPILIAVILAFVRPDEETKFSLVLLTGLSLTLESLQPE
jgi:hypothetical protein